ncbi:hypothetical protein ABKN59_007395 [Abortiporus biennis]
MPINTGHSPCLPQNLFTLCGKERGVDVSLFAVVNSYLFAALKIETTLLPRSSTTAPFDVTSYCSTCTPPYLNPFLASMLFNPRHHQWNNHDTRSSIYRKLPVEIGSFLNCLVFFLFQDLHYCLDIYSLLGWKATLSTIPLILPDTPRRL